MRRLALTILLGVTGCSALLSTSDFTGGNPAPPAAAGDGGSALDGGGAGGDADSSLTTAPDGASSGSDPRLRNAGVLKVSEADGKLSASVDGFFMLRFADVRFLHPTEWLDLGANANANLAGVVAFFQPPRARIGDRWIDDTVRGNAGNLDRIDDLPVRYSFDTFVHQFPNDPDESVDVKRWARFTVHATGRLVVRGRLAHGGGAAFDVTQWTYNDLGLTEAEPWEAVADPGNHSVAFFATSSSSSVNLVNLDSETTLAGAGAARHWTMPARRFDFGEEARRAEIQFGVTKADALARAHDARSPSLEVLAGADGVQSSYDSTLGTYVIVATSGDVSFRLGAGEDRHRPTFEFKSFAAPAWELLLDGKMIVSSSAISTPDGIAKTDASGRRVVAAYFGAIPKDAPMAARTFVLKRK